MMNQLSQEMQSVYHSQIDAVAQCNDYFFAGKELAQFDSAATNPNKMPTALKAIFDGLGNEWTERVDNAVKMGVEAYKARNGGEMPHATVIASALSAGANVIAQYKANPSYVTNLFDSVKAQSKEISGFDSLENSQYEQASIVPALTVVTIANVIANSLPIIALLPNPKGSVNIPVVAVRYTTDKTFGAMKAGEYLDGATASRRYAEGRFTYALSNGGTGTEYSVVATTAYDDYDKRTPKADVPLLPFLAGNVSIRINGKEVAHTRSDRDLSVSRGTVTPLIKRSVTIADKEYKITQAQILLDESKITVTLNEALPEGAKIEVALVANFDARDENNRDKFKLTPVGISLVPEYDIIQAVPVHSRIEIAVNTQNQLANELGLGFAGAALAIIQGKLFLEQNVRLLTEGRERAEFDNRYYEFDVSRGVAGNLTRMANTTGDLMTEITKYLDYAKMQIQQASGSSVAKFDLFVGNKGSIFFKQLPDSYFTPTGATASYGEIVRIGTLRDGTDVYHTPTEQGVVSEGVTDAEILLAGRGIEPVRNPFVGSIPMPIIIREAKPDGRIAVYDTIGQMAAELNPLDRYADQCAVIKMMNLQPLAAE